MSKPRARAPEYPLELFDFNQAGGWYTTTQSKLEAWLPPEVVKKEGIFGKIGFMDDGAGVIDGEDGICIKNPATGNVARFWIRSTNTYTQNQMYPGKKWWMLHLIQTQAEEWGYLTVEIANV